MIKNAGRRATELVQQILVFSRGTEQDWQPLRLQSVIKEVIKLLRSSLPTTVEIRQDVHADCRSVLADFTQIYGVTSSLEALELFRRDPDKFDIVITDQTMPNLTGYELAREIFKIRPNMPIIMVTGHSDIVDEQKVKEIGVLDLFMKPLDMNRLAKSISKVLRQ